MDLNREKNKELLKNKVIYNQQGKSVQTFFFDNSFLVGTVPGCDLRLGGVDLPPLLFQVIHERKTYSIRKLASLSGLTLNGLSFEENPLKTSDIVRLGGWEFVFEIHELAPGTILRHDPPHGTSKPKKQELPPRKRQTSKNKMLQWLVKKVRKRNSQLKLKHLELIEVEQKLADREKTVAEKESSLASEKCFLETQLRHLGERNQQEKQEIEKLRESLANQKVDLEREKSQLTNFQDLRDSDLARIARFQDMVDRKFQLLKERAKEVDRRGEELQKASRDLEEQALQISEMHSKIEKDRLESAALQAEKDLQLQEIRQKSSDLEHQLSQLVQMKLSLESAREQFRAREQSFQQRFLDFEMAESLQKNRLVEIERLENALKLEKQTLESVRASVQAQTETLESRKQLLLNQETDLLALGQQLAERDTDLQRRESYLADEESRLKEERAKLNESITNHYTKEKEYDSTGKSISQMQEALRLRFEEIEALRNELALKDNTLALELEKLKDRSRELEQDNQQTADNLANMRIELEKKELEITEMRADLEKQFHSLSNERQSHNDIKQEIFDALQRLEEEKTSHSQIQADIKSQEAANKQFGLELSEKLKTLSVELSLRQKESEDSLSKLLGARDLVKDHLDEFFSYAKEIRQDLEELRKEASSEEHSCLNLESKLNKAKEEHRLAMASFKQQLIEWHQKIADIKISLQSGEFELERKRTLYDQQAIEIRQQTEQLEKKEARLREEAQIVETNKAVIQVHLEDMQTWYRKKIRELSLGALSAIPNQYQTNDNASYSLSEEVEPSDKMLGDQMMELGLIDKDSLAVLLSDAKSRRHSLRQSLLSGGYLTFYQLALIETGNLSALMINRFRVIDKLPSSSRETAFLVFDPSHNRECILRILAESETNDPVHPDEFRQRFITACTIHHENVAKTYEVLEIMSKPAVVSEYIDGVPLGDYADACDNLGTWLRFGWQAVAGLASIHGTGMTFGSINESNLILQSNGMLKWHGAGQPHWLAKVAANDHFTLKSDISSLAQRCLSWIESFKSSLDSQEQTESYLKWLEEISTETTSTNLNEWLIRIGELLNDHDCTDETYAQQVAKLFSESTSFEFRQINAKAA